MSKAAVSRLKSHFGDKVLASSDFRGDDAIEVAVKDWVDVATFLRDDDKLKMNHFVDLTAVDYPEREGARFDLVLMVRSVEKKHRVRVTTKVADGTKPKTLFPVWSGANWAEREIYDMFGIEFLNHPDLRRILLYDEFIGFPLRKDYPIDKAQPLVPYRDAPGLTKLPPFGIDQGQPFGRIRWDDRLREGANGSGRAVSPSIALQTGERRALSDSEVAVAQIEELAMRVEEEQRVKQEQEAKKDAPAEG